MFPPRFPAWLLSFIQRLRFLLAVLVIVFCLVGLLIHHLNPVLADEIDDLQKQIDQLNQAREMSINATKPLQGQLLSLQAQLRQIQTNLQILSDKIDQKQKDLAVREDKIASEEAILHRRVRSFYVRSYFTSPLIT